jgi:hypothetical protein
VHDLGLPLLGGPFDRGCPLRNPHWLSRRVSELGPLLWLSHRVCICCFDGVGWICAVFIVVQMLESFVITPKVVGDKVGLNALVTLVALVIGGNVAGLLGMLVAVPVAGILRILYEDFKHRYFNSAFFLGSAQQ